MSIAAFWECLFFTLSSPMSSDLDRTAGRLDAPMEKVLPEAVPWNEALVGVLRLGTHFEICLVFSDFDDGERLIHGLLSSRDIDGMAGVGARQVYFDALADLRKRFEGKLDAETLQRLEQILKVRLLDANDPLRFSLGDARQAFDENAGLESLFTMHAADFDEILRIPAEEQGQNAGNGSAGGMN